MAQRARHGRVVCAGKRALIVFALGVAEHAKQEHRLEAPRDERRHELATVVPQPKSKLLKAQKKAEKKVKSMREDMDGDELQSNLTPSTSPDCP